MGESPSIANRIRLANASRRPARAKRVGSSTQAEQTKRDHQIGGDRKEAEDFGEDEEHARIPALTLFFHAS